MSAPDDFDDVLSKELKQIAMRREDSATAPDIPKEQAHASAREMDMSGLALSGGGIRSASFCLGVIQGLAGLGLLKRFDYLSTVSGGGYIGSWLTAWIKREGKLNTVEEQLRPNRVEQAEGRSSPSQPVEQEPQPIFHLRTYSNYLAPRLGLLSPDIWVLMAIYIRNFLLNQLVLLPTLLAVLLVPRLGMLFYAWRGGENREVVTWVVGGVLLLVVAVGFYFLLQGVSRLLITEAAPDDSTSSSPQTGLLTLKFGIVLPLAVASFLVCWFAGSENPVEYVVYSLTSSSQRENKPDKETLLRKMAGPLLELHDRMVGEKKSAPLYVWALLFGIPGAALFLLLHILFTIIVYLRVRWKTRKEPNCPPLHLFWWLVCGTLTGFAGSALLGVLIGIAGRHLQTQHQLPPDPWEELADQAGNAAATLTLGPPLALLVFVLGAIVHVGLMGRYLKNAVREWWGSVCGYVMRCGLYWLAFCALALFSAPLLLQGWSTAHALVGASWVGTSLGGVLAGFSPVTSGKKPGYLESFTRIAPYVFLGGLLIVLSWGLSACLDYPRSPGSQSPTHDYFAGLLNTGNAENPDHQLPDLLAKLGTVLGIFVAVALLASWCVGVNIFSLQSIYGNRLIRCYLGASRPLPKGDREAAYGAPSNCGPPPRDANPVTGLDPNDDLPLAELRITSTDADNPPDKLPANERPYRGPYHLINTALNLVHADELAYQERKAEAFLLSPLYCGSRSTGYRDSKIYARQVTLGDAMSISGAAASPNMGYHSSTAVTALLAIFDVRLGSWLGNPRSAVWDRHEPILSLTLLYKELFGQTDADSNFVYLSDGGHFENLGVYELVRRRCRFIVACDGDQDGDYAFDDLGGAIRKCRIDLGVPIEIDVTSIKPTGPNGHSKTHGAVGLIHYEAIDPQATPGTLVYLKTSLTGDEPADVLNYATGHRQFPHEPTSNQFFTESQLESYRALGQHIAEQFFKGALSGVENTSEMSDAAYRQVVRGLFANLRQR
ncbi:MAG TPA: patatin-like phospholipase family protein [Gemmataceae bacterium]|jgi:hypothetical protein